MAVLVIDHSIELYASTTFVLRFNICERKNKNLPTHITKTILIEVPAYYSSFIGNLMYDMYDPIAAAYELCRRGINKFKNGFKMIPDYNPDNIITDRLDENIDLRNFKSFTELFKSIRNKSYRRNNKTFSKYLLGQKTGVSLYT